MGCHTQAYPALVGCYVPYAYPGCLAYLVDSRLSNVLIMACNPGWAVSCLSSRLKMTRACLVLVVTCLACPGCHVSCLSSWSSRFTYSVCLVSFLSRLSHVLHIQVTTCPLLTGYHVSLIDNIHSDVARLRGFYGQLEIDRYLI